MQGRRPPRAWPLADLGPLVHGDCPHALALERLTSAIDEVDRRHDAVAPQRARHWALRRRVAADHPRHRPADSRHPDRRTRRVHPLHRCSGARRVCRLLPDHQRERRPRGDSPFVARGLSHCAPFALPRRRQCRAPEWRVAHHLPPQEGPGQNGHASAGRWPSSCFMRCTPCSSTGNLTTPSCLFVAPATIGS